MSDRKSAIRIEQPPASALAAAAKLYRIDAFFKTLLPPLTAEQRRELKDGVRKNGKCDPIKAARIKGVAGLPILWDGHNRDEIIAELRAEGASIADPVVEVTDFDSRSEVALEMIRNQDGRRNWTVAEKAFAIVSHESSNEIMDAAKKRQLSGKKVGLHEGQGKAEAGRTDKILGDMVGCGRDSIRKARNVLRHADPELIDAVRTQKVSLRDAHKTVVEKQFSQRAEQARLDRMPYEYVESDGWENQILCGHAAEKLRMIPANAASLVFFSPPYATTLVKYDLYNYDGDYRRWLRMLYRIIKRAAQTLREGGRAVINVDATSDCMKHVTTKYDVQYDVKTLAKRAGLTFSDDIAWFKQTTCGSDGHVAWGTYCSPHKPNIRRAHEYVLVFYKDSPFLEVDGIDGLSEEQVKEKRTSATDILPDEFRHATISAWNYDAKLKRSSDHLGSNGDEVNASSFWYIRAQKRDGSHPAPFSEPLAEMVMKTYSYRGDLVIDPFSGSGTTCAVAQRNGRRWVGIDLSADYCAVAQERLRKQNEKLRSSEQRDAKSQKPIRKQKGKSNLAPDEDADGEAGACVAA